MHDRQQPSDQQTRVPLIPVVPQPAGPGFFFQTWTGRIILINTVMFIVTVAMSGLFESARFSQEWIFRFFLSSDVNVLIRLGAKDSTLLALGEYWRFLTPLFIHGGFIHFAFNNWALYVVSYQIESLIKPRSFLVLYLLSGVAGNVASAVTSQTVSVGASGALFGLLGFGFYLERVIQARIQASTGNRPKAGAYTGMVVANILFGFMIPQIDNSAHIGGLAFGFTFAFIWLRQIPNRLMPLQKVQSRIATVLLLLVLGAGAWLGSSRWYVLYKLQGAIQSADHVELRYDYLNRLVALDPGNAPYRWHRLKLSLVLKDYQRARSDLQFFQNESAYDTRLQELEIELDHEGFVDGAAWLRRTRQEKPPLNL